MVDPVGFRFRPTDEEIVDHYLRLKTLGTDTSYVDRVISTVNICSFDPWDLPSQSMRKSRDGVWFFFGVKENKYNRVDQQNRKTNSGFWKKTGVTMDIMRKRGNREKIGEKKVLVFHFGKSSKILGGSKSDWVMHEYHATFSSPNQMMTYTICKVKFKGERREISASTGNEIENTHSLIPLMNNSGALSAETEGSSFQSQDLQHPSQFTGFLDVDALDMGFTNILSDDFKGLLDDVEPSKIVSMQDDRNNYKPQKSLTGVFIDHISDGNDSDLTSPTTSSIQTSSTCDSFGSSNYHFHQIKTQQSPNSTIKLVSLTQEVSQALDQGTEIQEDKLGQETIKKKRAGFFYRMIQRFVKKIQLCSSLSRT